MRIGSTTIQDPVEQWTPGGMTQPDKSYWTINPTRGNRNCPWDPDDRFTFGSNQGYLLPGESKTFSHCLIADKQDHLIGLTATSDRNSSFQLSYNYDDGNLQYALESNSRYDRTLRKNIAQFCTLTPDYATTLLTFIEGSIGGINSTGGYGKYATVSYTVTNTGTKKLSNIGILGELTLDNTLKHRQLCPFGEINRSDPNQCIRQNGGLYCWQTL